MYVAENIANPGPIKMYDVASAGLIEAQVKALSFEQRKNVVKKRIVVGKFDRGAHFDNKKAGVKGFVFLDESQSLCLGRICQAYHCGCSGSRLKPHHSVGGVCLFLRALSVEQFNLACDKGFLRSGADYGRRDDQDEHAPSSSPTQGYHSLPPRMGLKKNANG